VTSLITGFESWGKGRRNPSGEAARALGGHVLPVSYCRAGREISRLIRTTRPDAIVMLGLAEGRKKIGLEAVALNVDHCEGRPPWRRWRRRILKGPLARGTRLPIDRIHRRLRAARFPVAVSHSAGTFVCNHVFTVALARSRVPCGFIHVPPARVFPARRLVRAVRLILETLAVRTGRGVTIV